MKRPQPSTCLRASAKTSASCAVRQTDNEGEVPNNEALTLEEARDKDEIYLLSRRRKKKKNFLKPQYATR